MEGKSENAEKRFELLQVLNHAKSLIKEMDLNDLKNDIESILDKAIGMKDCYCKGKPFEGWKDYIRLNFTYDAETGGISRNDKKKSCGSYDSYGYLKIKIKGRSFSAHRLAWFLYYGVEPSKELDHINGDRADNRILNLMEVTRAENNYNRYHRPNKATGCVGISTKNCKSHILYQVHYRNKNYYFDSLEEAIQFRKERGLKL